MVTKLMSLHGATYLSQRNSKLLLLMPELKIQKMLFFKHLHPMDRLVANQQMVKEIHISILRSKASVTVVILWKSHLCPRVRQAAPFLTGSLIVTLSKNSRMQLKREERQET